MIEPHRRARQWNWPRRLRKIDNLQSVIVRDETVTELNGDAARVAQEISGERPGDARMHWVANIDNVQTARGRHVKPMTGCGDEGCTAQNAVGIEPDRVGQEIIIGISVHQSGDVWDDEPLFAVRNVNKGVERIDWLLFIFWQMQSRRIECERARQRDAGCIFRVDARALTKRRDRCADDAFRETFLVDVGNVEDLETAGAVRSVKIFAAQHDVLNVFPGMFVRFLQLAANIDMLFVVRWIGDLLQVAADDCLRFIRFCPNNRVKSFAAFADIRVAPKKVHRAGTEA